MQHLCLEPATHLGTHVPAEGDQERDEPDQAEVGALGHI